MQIIPEVANNTTFINSAEFVKIKIFNEYIATPAANITIGNTYQIYSNGNTAWTSIGASSNAVGTVFTANSVGTGTGNAYDISIYAISSSYKVETIGNIQYLPMGGLLQVGAQNRDLRVTSADTTVTLSGIDGNNIYTVLATKIRGSEMEIIRGFYGTSDGNIANLYTLTNTYPRFTGIITTYGIGEDREASDDNFTVSVGASSYKTVLENRIAGRKTNEESWKFFNSTDTSMDRVYDIAGTQFDFGQNPDGRSVVPGAGIGTGTGVGVGRDNLTTDDYSPG